MQGRGFSLASDSHMSTYTLKLSTGPFPIPSVIRLGHRAKIQGKRAPGSGIGAGLLVPLDERDQPAGSLGDGSSAAQGTLRPVCVACVALSSLVSSMQNGKSPVQGLRKVVFVTSSARRQFPSQPWDPDHAKSCIRVRWPEAVAPGLVPFRTLQDGWLVG